LHPQAVGWDWMGINLFDGSALTAFQLRDKEGRALWDGGSFRSGGGTRYVFSRGEVLFRPLRSWRSALSKASYPVEWIVRTPADYYTVKAVVDDQELDSRNSTGAIYWEGLCEVWDSNKRLVGRGYLEMTGYAAALKL
jgi:predicted secreted hydrolase